MVNSLIKKEANKININESVAQNRSFWGTNLATQKIVEGFVRIYERKNFKDLLYKIMMIK